MAGGYSEGRWFDSSLGSKQMRTWMSGLYRHPAKVVGFTASQVRILLFSQLKSTNMKARVKATGEYVEVKPERDGFFIDEANSNPYKFDELDFIDTPDQQSNMFAGLLGSMLNPLAGLDKSMDSQFWVSKHSECIFKLLDLLKDRFVEKYSKTGNYRRKLFHGKKILFLLKKSAFFFLFCIAISK